MDIYTGNTSAVSEAMLCVTMLLQCLQNNRINTQWYITGPVDTRLACLDATQQRLCSELKKKLIPKTTGLTNR